MRLLQPVHPLRLVVIPSACPHRQARLFDFDLQIVILVGPVSARRIERERIERAGISNAIGDLVRNVVVRVHDDAERIRYVGGAERGAVAPFHAVTQVPGDRAAIGADALSKRSSAESACPKFTCTSQAEVNQFSSSDATGNVSIAMLIVGGAGLAGAAVLWFTAPSSGGRSTRVGFGPGSVQLAATW